MDVLVYRETLENKWAGPLEVIAGNRKALWQNENRKLAQDSIAKVLE